MGSIVDDVVEEKAYDVENTIFVAVGQNVAESKRTLFWAVQSFAGMNICLLHVHQPPTDRKLAANQDAFRALLEVERKRMLDVLNQYSLILDQEGVQADKVWIEMENIEEGIVEIIAQNSIRWLVMGSAANEHYSKNLEGLKSKKARFVCQHAPISCHIWFSSKGCLFYASLAKLEGLNYRQVAEQGSAFKFVEGRNDISEAEFSLPLLEDNSDLGMEQPAVLTLASFNIGIFYSSPWVSDAEEDDDDLEEIFGRFGHQCSADSSASSNEVLSTSKSMPLLIDKEEINQGQPTRITCHKLEQAILHAKDSKQKAFEEAIKRWKEEDEAMEARCKAKALENLCIKEISLRKRMEGELTRKKKEVEKMKNQREEFINEIQKVHEQKSVLEGQLAETSCVVKDLEEKIISAVELLVSFKAKRDAARTEYENAKREVNRQRKLAEMEAVSFCRSSILELSFVEINEATQDFDPSWRIGEGRYGSVYKGILRHVHVAIKMLPSYGSQSQLDFQNGMEILSRVRHPHLVTIIGTCPESRSLVYEYVANGSLEDYLTCKNKRLPLPWQTRIRIATEICSALIFLHSNKPSIIHGNLKPSKILLDTNYISKVGDFGISLLIPNGEKTGNTSPVSGKCIPNLMSVYADPECSETGTITPESDVYSFGIILLRLLTGRPVSGLLKDVKCAMEKENLKALLDCSSGDWPIEQAELLAELALRCCQNNRLNRPDLVSEIWNVLEPMRTSQGDSSSYLCSKDLHRIPSHFVCPIFQEVMKDPHIAADGFTYDADAIRGWLKSGHNTSPMTNLKLEHCNLLPNHALHQAIQEWRQLW